MDTYGVSAMGKAKEIVDIIAKQIWLVYFLLIWAGSFIMWAIYGFTWGFGIENANDALGILADLIKLATGVVLAILGLKLLGKDLIPAVAGEKLFVYFLLLWAGTFFLSGLSDIVYYARYVSQYWQYAMGIVSALFDLAAGAILALAGWQLFQKDPQPPPPP